MDLRATIIDNVSISVRALLSDEQLQAVQDALTLQLNGYELQERTTEVAVIDSTPDAMLSKFIATKRIEGKSEATVQRYRDVCYMMIHSLCKPLYDITTYDLRYYLASYKQQRSVSNRTLDGMRRCFSSFFGWLSAEGLIGRNPCAALAQIKYAKVVKKPYTEPEMERLKQACTSIRDLALLEFLYASGCRVSEVVRLNRSDINFLTRDAVVLGKGNKERTIYLTPVALMHLQDYLNTRKDNNPALFASLKAPYERLSKAGIETTLKQIGKRAGVENVHPHRYRRTLATNLLDRGANIQDVATILGHADLKTTQIYCYISQQNVQAAYRRYAA